MPATHQMSKDLDWLAAEIETRSNGKITVEPYHGGELYGHITAPDAVISGAMEMAVEATGGVWPSLNPFFKGIQMWFLARDGDQIYSQIDKLRDITWPLYEDLGIIPLCYWSIGKGVLWSTSPIHNPSQLKGKIIRAPTEGDWASIEAFGGTAAQIPSGEMYDALAKGSIDGMRTGLTSGISRKLYEVATDLALPTQFTLFFTFANPDWWNGLPQEYRDIIRQAHIDVEARSFVNMKTADEKSMETARQYVNVHVYTDEENAQWAAGMQPVYDNWIAECDAAGYGDAARAYYELFK